MIVGTAFSIELLQTGQLWICHGCPRMTHPPIQDFSYWTLVSVGLVSLVVVGSLFSQPNGVPPVPAPRTEKKAAPPSDQPRERWRAFGRVTDQAGQPLAGVEVSAHCGYGTLRRTGVAISSEHGRYELSFGPGISYVDRSGTPTQAATITAHKAGYFEVNLNRQGDCVAADVLPSEEVIKSRAGRTDRVFLPDRPLEVNFVMRPAGRVAGWLVDEQGQPLIRYSVALSEADIPPSSNVMCSTETDKQGRFSLEDIPTTFRFQFEVRKADPKPPWDDSWASAPLRFEKPDTGDVRAWFGNREIRLQEFVLRVAGPGVHGRSATPIAGKLGVLNLTVGSPTDLLERSDSLLVAKSAALTLSNAPRQDLSQSLTIESVPVTPASEAKTQRTLP
jgi:hypothetical protein